MRTTFQFSSVLVAIALGGATAWAQVPTTPALPNPSTTTFPASATVPDAPPLRSEEIDALVAPIALYPDNLLAQVLIASTYPLEIAIASQW